MTNRAKYLQIAFFVIFSIPVFVMYTKDLLYFCISTNFTLVNHAPSQHSFSNGGINGFKFLFRRFVDAFSRAKDSIATCAIFKFYSAIQACEFFCTSAYLRSMKAQLRAVFSFSFSHCDIGKWLRTYQTVTDKLLHLVFCLARQRAVFSRLNQIGFYFDNFFTNNTSYIGHICH